MVGKDSPDTSWYQERYHWKGGIWVGTWEKHEYLDSWVETSKTQWHLSGYGRAEKKGS